jgi:hypothetical protein
LRVRVDLGLRSLVTDSSNAKAARRYIRARVALWRQVAQPVNWLMRALFVAAALALIIFSAVHASYRNCMIGQWRSASIGRWQSTGGAG